MPANIAEGVGEYARRDKAKFYRYARRSAVESASHIIVLQRLDLVAERDYAAAVQLLKRIIGMLTNLIRRMRSPA